MLECVGLLCDGVELLRERDNVFELVDRIDSLGDGAGVILSGSMENGFNALFGYRQRACPYPGILLLCTRCVKSSR